MDEIKPIRRSIALQPLSREHHDALLFIWKLRQGLSNDTSVYILRNFVTWFWKSQIKAHFYQEEKILLPLVQEGHPLAARLKADHDEIREMILSIDSNPDRYDFTWLCNHMESHIRFEEREFFPFFEQQHSPEKLAEIKEKLDNHPQHAEKEWTEAFWTKQKAQGDH